MRHAISRFVRQQNTVQKTLAKALPGVLDALNLHQINPDADNHGDEYRSITNNISFTATARPTVIARLTIECPIFNSTKCGVSKRMGTFWVFKPWPALT